MRKSKTDTVKGGVLAENQAKINSADKAIKAALDRRRKDHHGEQALYLRTAL